MKEGDDGEEQQAGLPDRRAALSVPYVLEQTTQERGDQSVRIAATISARIPRPYAESSCRSPCVLDAHVRRCMKRPLSYAPAGEQTRAILGHAGGHSGKAYGTDKNGILATI